MTTTLSRLYDFIFLHFDHTSIEASETDDVIDSFYNFIPKIGKYYCHCGTDQSEHELNQISSTV